MLASIAIDDLCEVVVGIIIVGTPTAALTTLCMDHTYFPARPTERCLDRVSEALTSAAAVGLSKTRAYLGTEDVAQRADRDQVSTSGGAEANLS